MADRQVSSSSVIGQQHETNVDATQTASEIEEEDEEELERLDTAATATDDEDEPALQPQPQAEGSAADANNALLLLAQQQQQQQQNAAVHPSTVAALQQAMLQQQQQQLQTPPQLGPPTTTGASAFSAVIPNQPQGLVVDQQHAAALQQFQQEQLAAATLLAVHEQQQQQQQQQAAVTHNLIPYDLQATALAASLNGTPGYPSVLIPPNLMGAATAPPPPNPMILDPIPAPVLTVQDVAGQHPPVYNGVNPNYPGLRVLHNSPPIFCVDQFLSPAECEFLIRSASDAWTPAPVVGKGAGEVSPSRTSSTCYLARQDLPDLMRKVSLLTGKPADHCELPQVGRYLPTQQYLQHYDAFDLSNDDGRRFASNGGQRTITCLIYLNNVMSGGATRFPALNLQVQPVQGMCLVFFPATVDGLLDKQALHAALPAVDVKYVSQVWIRQSTYNGQPSKRLTQTMGVPFGQEAAAAAAAALALQQQQQQQQQQAAMGNAPPGGPGPYQ